MGTDAEELNINQNDIMAEDEQLGNNIDSANDTVDGENNDTEETDDISDRKSSDNAATLLKQAIKHLEDDNEKTAINYIELAVKYLKGKADIEKVDSETDDKLYGECRNFGVIYKIMESNCAELYKSDNGRQVIKEFVSLIKSDKAINEQFNYYSLYTDNNNKYDDVASYVNEAVSYTPSVSKKALKEGNQKLIDILRKGKVNEMVEISDDEMSLYEAIEATILSKSSSRQINEMVNAKATLKNYLSNKKELAEAKKITYKDYQDAVNEAVKELSESLSEDEISLLQEMYNPDCDKKEKFDFYKQDTLKRISNVMNTEADSDNKARLSKIYIQINEQQYNEHNALLDVAKFISVKNILD